MKKWFSKQKTLGLLIPLLSIGGVVLSCSKGTENISTYKQNPKYILNGNAVGNQPNNGKYDYYYISSGTYSGTYAISLKEDYITTSLEINDIPKKYNDGVHGENEVTGIWRSGFANSNITKITLRNTNIAVIDFEAFLGCNHLGSIIIPYTVTEIGDAAFYGCKAITSAVFDNSKDAASGASSSACACLEPEEINDEEEEENGEEEEENGEGGNDTSADDSKLAKIPDFCFFNCTSMTELQLPAKITEIGYEAFNGCVALKSTLAFQSIEIIRERAFQGCSSLTTVYIPSTFFESDGVIEAHAFNYCFKDLDFYFAGNSASTWATSHPNWGLYSDTDNSKKYTYKPTGANTQYSGEWTFTVDPVGGGDYDVTITGYTGPTILNEKAVDYISIPNNLPLGNKHYKVREINKNVFSDTLKSQLKRIYLPTTLRWIGNFMFDDHYDSLVVIDSNTGNSMIDAEVESYTTDCNKDAASQNVVSRIILSDLEDLEVIGDCAFTNMDKREEITKLYLPAGLKAVGNSAFGSSKSVELTYGTETFTVLMKHMKKVTDFKWKYDESKAQLVGVGNDAFYKLGADDNGTDIKKEDGTVPHPSIDADGKEYHKTMTLVLPKTFRHTGFTNDEADAFRLHHNADKVNNKNVKFKGEHAFAGCPLIGNVIIKGSPVDANGVPQDDNDVKDLVIGLQAFAYLECCRNIIIEERKDCTIAFHTQIGKWTEPCIGWNSGKGQNDFTGDPFLQTLVLPNKYTNLVFQEFAFQANSRAALYFSGSSSENLYSDYETQQLEGDGYTKIVRTSGSTHNLNNIDYWNLIGNEAKLKARKSGQDQTFVGYYIDPEINKFGISQWLPTYYNVHYKESFNVDGNNIAVEVGTNSCTKDLVFASEQGTNVDDETINFQKYAFVCDAGTGNDKKATLSKYLYDRWMKNFSGTAHVPATVNNKAGASCEVNAIGDSAFSAAFCDGKHFKITDGTTFKDLTAVEIPDTVLTIGDYAFMRAYGVTKVSTYNVSTDAVSDFTMPSDLDSIGRHAFAFCNVQKLLGIPNDCELYETSNDFVATDYYLTSAFTNNFSLREITFQDSDGAGTTDDIYHSDYYEVTKYIHTADPTPDDDVDDNVYYTSALYSNSSARKNANRLLVVLYRENGDKNKESEDINSDGYFNGLYKTNPYLYGAYKMGYWIDKLTVGNPTLDNSGNKVAQPIFSGLYDRTNDADYRLYLGQKSTKYDSINTNLTTIEFDGGLDIQANAFEGCNNLKRIRFPHQPGITIPTGILANTSITNFEVPVPKEPGDEGYDPDVTTYKYVDKGTVLDLTHTGYAGIADASGGGSGVFQGSSKITKFIAPAVTNFTVGSQAFKSCGNLADLDFSNVTGSVSINTSAFESCSKLNNITFRSGCNVTIGNSAFKGATIQNTGGFTWPSTGTVSLGTSAFENCKFNSHSISLAVNTNSVGSSCFKGCSTLQTVTSISSLSLLTSIGESAFENCSNLNGFDFDKFTALQTIGSKAFYTETGTPSITSNGIINLPNAVTRIDSYAFKNSGITGVIVNSNALSLETEAFANCASLQYFYFANANCNFTSKGNTYGFFNSCGNNFQKLFMPTAGLGIGNSLSGSIVANDSNAKIYSYSKYATAPVSSSVWREYDVTSHFPADIVLFAENSADCNYNALINNQTFTFWAYSGTAEYGNAVYLGYVTDISGDIITFSEGYTMNSSGLVI